MWNIHVQPGSWWGWKTEGEVEGAVCGSGTRSLHWGGDSPALGSGLQLPVQSHREAKETTRLALLAQGAHHVQVEGDSPQGEQAGEQGTKKVTNPGTQPRVAAQSPSHWANTSRAPPERKAIHSRPEPRVSQGGESLVSSHAGFSGVSQPSPSPALPRRAATPAPAATTAAAALGRPLRGTRRLVAAPPRPLLLGPRPLAPWAPPPAAPARRQHPRQVEAARSPGKPRLRARGGNRPCSLPASLAPALPPRVPPFSPILHKPASGEADPRDGQGREVELESG